MEVSHGDGKARAVVSVAIRWRTEFSRSMGFTEHQDPSPAAGTRRRGAYALGSEEPREAGLSGSLVIWKTSPKTERTG
jgi:hypothetical protein